jgi:hypothetical protein
MNPRYIPEGATTVANKSGSAVAYLYTRNDKKCAIGYIGKSAKKALHFSYANDAKRMTSVSMFLRSAEAGLTEKLARKADKKAALAKPHGLKVGSVLRSSWGYDQTNIDFYEVTALVGVRMVEVREIGSQIENNGFMCGVSVPAKGQFVGKVLRKLVDQYDGVHISSCQYATKFEPKVVAGVEIFPVSSWTAYA